MAPDIEMLRGMAIQEDTGIQKMLKLFNVHQLPAEPAARFRAVFQEQHQWTLPALQAYIEDLQACFSPMWCLYFQSSLVFDLWAQCLLVSVQHFECCRTLE